MSSVNDLNLIGRSGIAMLDIDVQRLIQNQTVGLTKEEIKTLSCLYFHYVIFHSPYLHYLEDYHLLLQRRMHRTLRLFHTTHCSIYVGKVSELNAMYT